MGWSPVQGVLPTTYKILNFRNISEWEQTRRKAEEEEEEEEESSSAIVDDSSREQST
jgi:hypothetical protein